MLISCIMATYHREELLARAVQSVLDQDVDAEFEVIVVNDAGEPLSPAPWQADRRVTILNTNHVDRCFVWNTGVSIARGEWINILDDDDYLLPGAYAALIRLQQTPDVDWVYAAYECVDDAGHRLEVVSPSLEGDVFAHAVADIGIPKGASLIRREAFINVGGFDHALMFAEDRDLIQRIALRGRFAAATEVVACFRVAPEVATTTLWSRAARLGWQMRENRFSDPHCLPRLLESLSKREDISALRGRLVRFYGASAVRHAGSSPLTAISRAIIALSFAVTGIPNSRFLSGLRGRW